MIATSIGGLLLVLSWAAIGFVGLADYPDLMRRLQDAVGDDSYTLYIAGLDLGLPSPAARALWLAVGVGLLAAVVWAGRRGDERSRVHPHGGGGAGAQPDRVAALLRSAPRRRRVGTADVGSRLVRPARDGRDAGKRASDAVRDRGDVGHRCADDRARVAHVVSCRDRRPAGVRPIARRCRQRD